MALSARQNYSEECEAGVNKQVNGELCAMYTYMAMVSQISDVQIKLLEKLLSEWQFALWRFSQITELEQWNRMGYKMNDGSCCVKQTAPFYILLLYHSTLSEVCEKSLLIRLLTTYRMHWLRYARDLWPLRLWVGCWDAGMQPELLRNMYVSK